MNRLLLTTIAAVALTVSGCATPPVEKSSAGGAADRAAARTQDGSKEKGRKLPWWRLSQYSRKPASETPEERFRNRPGLFSGKDGGIVLYREGEGGGGPSASGKPTKVKR